MKNLRRALTCLVLAGSASLLSAVTPDFGVQGALAIPAGDLSDGANLGIQGGGHAWWHFQGGHALMARVDATFYGSKDGLTVNSFGVAADYTFFPESRGRGLYLLGGLSFLRYELSAELSDSRNKLGLDLGVGYQFNRALGMQLRYTTHEIDSLTFASANVGVTYTF